MALIDIVKYNSNDSEFVWKFPSEELKIGTQLIVNTAQRAFFVKGGKILDEFESGTHQISSDNIPLLNKLINLPFGGESPFLAEVWYVNMLSVLDNKWGTPNPIQIEDPKYKIIIPVRAYGQFGIAVEDPKMLLKTLVGNMHSFSTERVIEYFKGRLISAVSSALATKIVKDNISVLEIDLHLDAMSEFCIEKLQIEFNKYGLKVVNFYFISISVPQDDPSIIKLKEAKELAATVSITGRDIYQLDRSYDVLDKAVENDGTMSGIMGAGLGLGLGNQMGNLAGNMAYQNATPPPVPANNPIYYVLINNQQVPTDLNGVKNLLMQGQVNTGTLAWKQGMPAWQRLDAMQEFSGLFPPPPPPPLP